MGVGYEISAWTSRDRRTSSYGNAQAGKAVRPANVSRPRRGGTSGGWVGRTAKAGEGPGEGGDEGGGGEGGGGEGGGGGPYGLWLASELELSGWAPGGGVGPYSRGPSSVRSQVKEGWSVAIQGGGMGRAPHAGMLDAASASRWAMGSPGAGKAHAGRSGASAAHEARADECCSDR